MNRLFRTWGLVVFTAALASCASTSTQRTTSAVHSSVTPFDSLKSRLRMEEGQTYLSFMQSEVRPEMDKYDGEIRSLQKQYPNQYSKWQDQLIASGSGVAIRIDGDNYFFNVGYGNGSDSDDIKSGRSYGVGPTQRESDPSDLAYLSELGNYYKKEPGQVPLFFEAILRALLDNDSSGWKKLSEDGQIVATDFMAIYTAESRRHLMVDLDPFKHPWEIDLAAATFVSVYVTETNKIMKDGQLAAGETKDWWAKGNSGSGIGNTRRDRIQLQKNIAQALANDPKATAAVKAITSVIGDLRGGKDVIQGLFEFLNSKGAPKGFSDSQKTKLISAVQDYMAALKAKAAEI